MVALKHYGAPGAVAVMAAVRGRRAGRAGQCRPDRGPGREPVSRHAERAVHRQQHRADLHRGRRPDRVPRRCRIATATSPSAMCFGMPTEIVHRARGAGDLLCRAGVVDPRQAHPCHRPAAPCRRGRGHPHRPLSGADVHRRLGDLRPGRGDPLGQSPPVHAARGLVLPAACDRRGVHRRLAAPALAAERAGHAAGRAVPRHGRQWPQPDGPRLQREGRAGGADPGLRAGALASPSNGSGAERRARTTEARHADL